MPSATDDADSSAKRPVSPHIHDVLQCRRLEIFDEQGRTRLTVGLNTDSPEHLAEVAIYSSDGRLALLLCEVGAGVGCIGVSDGVDACASGVWINGRSHRTRS